MSERVSIFSRAIQQSQLIVIGKLLLVLEAG
jgi:hypothetical protein